MRFGANSSEAKSALVLLFVFLHFCTKETKVLFEEVLFGIVNPINGKRGGGVSLELEMKLLLRPCFSKISDL